MLSECWLSSAANIPGLQGFTYYKTNDNYNQNDGVVIYLRSDILCAVEEPNFMDANCLIIKIKSHTAIVTIYRPPSFQTLDNFLVSLGNILKSLTSFRNVILVGDININLLNHGQDTSLYLDTLVYYGLLPATESATRGEACLDHVIIKTKLKSFTFNLATTITDHAAVLFCLENSISDKTLTNNSFSKLNLNNFKKDCSTLDFDPIFKENNLNIALNTFIEYMSQTILKNSINIKLPRSKITFKPWITTGLLRCIRNRDKMHSKIRLQPGNEILVTSYKRYRNFCNNLLKKLKRQYEKDQLIMNRDNSKKLWETIRKVTNSNIQKNPASELLLSEDTPSIAVNKTNEFFATIGRNLADKITSIPPVLNSSKSSVHSFVLLPTDHEEVEHTIMQLKSDCSPGWDLISAKALLAVSHIITPVLTDIINRCLINGIFPDALKKSIVHPIFKGGDSGCVNCYRPISILTTLSKIFERIINKRLTKYLEQQNLLTKTQYGFRTGKSTDDAVHDFTDFLIKKIDKNKKCISIFLDLAKAFDTVSVPHLIQKLNNMGIRGTQLSLFSDYLNNRSQCVKVGDYFSDYLPIRYGVPQGSIMGPTLFLCYINDICQLDIENCRIASYADNTTLTFYASNWDQLHTLAQTGFDKVMQWLKNNSLTLNADKTKFIVFTINKPVSLPFTEPLIAHNCSNLSNYTCDCPTITRTQSIKYLGVIIDNHLRFDLHIQTVAQRVRKLAYIFKQLRFVADDNLLKMVYLALVQSVVSYCITSWGGATKTRMLGLERAQRMILKICLFKPRLFPTDQLYQEADVLSIRQLYVLQTVLRQHSEVSLETYARVATSRRFYSVCEQTFVNTSIATRFYHFRGGRLYNSLNKTLNMVKLCRNECKNKISKWIKKLNYIETEKLLDILS